MCADDVALFTESKDGLYHLINTPGEYCHVNFELAGGQ